MLFTVLIGDLDGRVVAVVFAGPSQSSAGAVCQLGELAAVVPVWFWRSDAFPALLVAGQPLRSAFLSVSLFFLFLSSLFLSFPSGGRPLAVLLSDDHVSHGEGVCGYAGYIGAVCA